MLENIDYSQYSIESYLNGSHDPVKEDYFTVDPKHGQEVLSILTDTNMDYSHFMTESLSYLGQAQQMSASLDYFLHKRDMKIAMCKAFTQLSKNNGYAMEYTDYWYALESDDKKSSDDKNWFQKMWETIKHILVSIEIAVINFIKAVGNFIKGAMCKAQDVFYKTYAKDIKKHITDYQKKSDNYELKFKIRGASDKKIWVEYPWEVLKHVSTNLVKAFQIMHTIVIQNESIIQALSTMSVSGSGGASELKAEKVESNKEALIDLLVKALKGIDSSDESVKLYEKMKKELGKWYPSVKETVNMLIYGKENPTKYEYNIMEVIDNETVKILSPAALTAMTYAFNTAKQANKSLMTGIKVAAKMEKQRMDFDGKTVNGSMKEAIRVNGMMIHKTNQFTTGLLITLYGTCLSARMAIFSAAKKLYKKGEYDADTSKKTKKKS